MCNRIGWSRILNVSGPISKELEKNRGVPNDISHTTRVEISRQNPQRVWALEKDDSVLDQSHEIRKGEVAISWFPMVP